MAAHQSVGLFFVRRHCLLEMEAFIIEHQVTTSSSTSLFSFFFLRNSNKTETDFQKKKNNLVYKFCEVAIIVKLVKKWKHEYSCAPSQALGLAWC